jgi:hypothetical protein
LPARLRFPQFVAPRRNPSHGGGTAPQPLLQSTHPNRNASLENAMNNTSRPNVDRSNAPQPLLSAGARFAIAVIVATAASAAWITAERASTQAVQTDVQAFAPGKTYVTLPSVEIVGHRERAAAKPVHSADDA